MNLKYLKFIFLLLPFFFSSCKKDGLESHDNTILTGLWYWKYSEGGITGGKITPEANRLVVLTFRADSTFSVLDKGNIPLTGDYHITEDPNYGRIIHFDPTYLWYNGEVFTIKDDQLTLMDYQVDDGFVHYFQRIK